MLSEHDKLIFDVIDCLIKGRYPSSSDLKLEEHEYIDILNEIQQKLGYIDNIYFISDERTGIKLIPILSSSKVTAMGLIFHEKNKTNS